MGQPFSNTSEELDIQTVNLEATGNVETIRGSSPSYALSIHVTFSPSQSRETVSLSRSAVQ